MDNCPRCQLPWSSTRKFVHRSGMQSNCDRCEVVYNEWGLFLHIGGFTVNWMEDGCVVFPMGHRINEIRLPHLSYKVSLDELKKYMVLV